MIEFLTCVAIAAVPVAFILARIAVGRRYRVLRAPEPKTEPNLLQVTRNLHPAILAALAGHPDCNERSMSGVRQTFDCALATLMDLTARGILRLRSVSSLQQGAYSVPAEPVTCDASTARPRYRSSSYAPYASLVLERSQSIRIEMQRRSAGDAAAEGEAAALDPLDRLTIDAFLPEVDALCAADLLTSLEKHWSEVAERLKPFREELEHRLWAGGYLDAALESAVMLARWPFRLTMLWLLAWLIALAAGWVDRTGPALPIFAVLVAAVLTAHATIPISPRLTSAGLTVGRAALALRDTLATGALTERARREGADAVEAGFLRYASTWSKRCLADGYLLLRAAPDAWRIALELAVCGGDMRSADGPQGFSQPCHEIDGLVRSAPGQVSRRDGFHRLARWCMYGDPTAAGELGNPPLAVRMHDIALMNCGECSS